MLTATAYKPQIAPKPKLVEYDKNGGGGGGSGGVKLKQQKSHSQHHSPSHETTVVKSVDMVTLESNSKPLSLLEEIYAEIEDKHAKSSLLKTLTSEYSSYSSSSSNSSAYSSYSSYSSSSSETSTEPPPPLPNVPPPPLSTSANSSTLQQEIEREISSKFVDSPFKFEPNDLRTASDSAAAAATASAEVESFFPPLLILLFISRLDFSSIFNNWNDLNKIRENLYM